MEPIQRFTFTHINDEYEAEGRFGRDGHFALGPVPVERSPGVAGSALHATQQGIETQAELEAWIGKVCPGYRDLKSA